MTNFKSKRQQYLDEFSYFLGRLNLRDSALDCRAIQFMNEHGRLLDEVICEGEINGKIHF